jgi:hypothetical protein
MMQRLLFQGVAIAGKFLVEEYVLNRKHREAPHPAGSLVLPSGDEKCPYCDAQRHLVQATHFLHGAASRPDAADVLSHLANEELLKASESLMTAEVMGNEAGLALSRAVGDLFRDELGGYESRARRALTLSEQAMDLALARNLPATEKE